MVTVDIERPAAHQRTTALLPQFVDIVEASQYDDLPQLADFRTPRAEEAPRGPRIRYPPMRTGGNGILLQQQTRQRCQFILHVDHPSQNGLRTRASHPLAT
ncbi:MAG: hypothetical protein ACN6QT_07625 [Burkholderia contaminans]|uniref:Uncharacterized protein n=1 Tax=Burkholderia contaminans TaxID=488447 RepID=A0AAP4RAD9_9BURK|nr:MULTISPECIES: hypothetical protein [Burkholderia]MDN7569751.1 hypothetical protein [Burkholderia contaminans]